MRFKNLIAAAALLITAYLSLATSQPLEPRAPTSGTFYLISDCIVPTLESVVTVSGSTIIAPGGMSFLDFGFPSATITQSMTGTVGAVTRECTVTYGEDGTNHVDNRWLYSCFDSGKFKCSIYAHPQ